MSQCNDHEILNGLINQTLHEKLSMNLNDLLKLKKLGKYQVKNKQFLITLTID